MAKEPKKNTKSGTPLAGSATPSGYAGFLDGLKTRIRTAQIRAALAANSELVLLYWRIGRDIQAEFPAAAFRSGT